MRVSFWSVRPVCLETRWVGARIVFGVYPPSNIGGGVCGSVVFSSALNEFLPFHLVPRDERRTDDGDEG